MQINKFMGVVSSILALSSVANSQGVTKTTFAQGVAENVLSGDSRLGRKALIEAEGISVSELLAQISRASGVMLKADLVVADDKVVVFSAARPLRDSLFDLAALFNDTWVVGKAANGKPMYLLTRSKTARDYENALLSQMTRRIRQGLDVSITALQETPAQLAKATDDDAVRQYLRHPYGRLGTRVYAQLTPAQRERLLTHRHVVVPFRAMPAGLQQELRDFNALHIAEKKAAQRKSPEDTPLPIPDEAELEHGLLRISLEQVHSGILGRVSYGASSGLIIGWLDTRSLYIPAMRGNPYTGKPATTAFPLPTAQAITTVKLAAAWPDRLRKLAEVTHAPVFADYYRSPAVILERESPANATTANVEHDSSAALDSLCRLPGYCWWMQGKTLLLRKRDWYDQQRYEAPDRWIRATLNALAAHEDKPTYADAFRLLQLTPRQMMGLCGDCDEVNQYDMFEFSGAPELLALAKATILNPDAPLAEGGVIVPAETLAVQYPLQTLNPTRKTLLAAFEKELHFDLPSPASKVFRAEASYGGMVKNRQRNYLYHRINLTAKYDNDVGEYLTQISLPAALMDDRRDKTRVEMTP